MVKHLIKGMRLHSLHRLGLYCTARLGPEKEIFFDGAIFHFYKKKKKKSL